MTEFQKDVLENIMMILACSLVGYGTHSWAVGVGLYFCFALNAERNERNMKRISNKEPDHF